MSLNRKLRMSEKILEVKNLKKYFGGIKAVDNCSFEVEKSKIVALIGPNGAGKTTVFNIISGIIKADAGKVIFKGREITNLAPEKIANLGIARIFQQSRLFKNLSVEENLKIALNEDDTSLIKSMIKRKDNGEVEKKIKEALKLVRMEKFLHRKSSELSYGQMRLIEIARALLKKHELLMLDEPVAGVNPGIRQEIAELLLNLRKKGETILLIEHDMNFTLRISDEIIVLDEGKVIAEGKPEEIKNNPKVIEAYLGD